VDRTLWISVFAAALECEVFAQPGACAAIPVTRGSEMKAPIQPSMETRL
jgi:hypothetical protein